MRFKIDENLPLELTRVFAEKGHSAETVFEEGLQGRDDQEVSARCQSEKRALITLDTDFADIRTYPPKQYAGLVVLRLRRQDKPHALAVMERVIRLLEDEPLQGKLWIIGEQSVRIR